MTADDIFNRYVYKLDESSQSWTVVHKFACGFYSLACHHINNFDILIFGGILEDGTENRSIHILTFAEHNMLMCSKLNIDDDTYLDVMLVGFSSIFDPVRNRIVTFGGGGNCFSFGTYFNGSKSLVLTV